MRIPFLILCLAVVYGACRTYGREESNIDLTRELKNNGDYKFDLAPTTDLPLERFFSRHRRFVSLLSPLSSITSVTNSIDTALKLFGFDNCIISTIVSTIADGIKLIYGALTGQDVCPKVEKLSLDLNAIIHPIETAKAAVCYIFQTIGSGTRALIRQGFKVASQFFRTIFLPGLHAMLNAINKTGLLPPQISALIVAFDSVYKLLQLLGYVPK